MAACDDITGVLEQERARLSEGMAAPADFYPGSVSVSLTGGLDRTLAAAVGHSCTGCDGYHALKIGDDDMDFVHLYLCGRCDTVFSTGYEDKIEAYMESLHWAWNTTFIER